MSEIESVVKPILDFVEDHSFLIVIGVALVLTFLYFHAKENIENFVGAKYPDVFNKGTKDSSSSDDLDEPPKKVLSQKPPPSLDKDLTTLQHSKKNLKPYNLLDDNQGVNDVSAKDSYLDHYRHNYGDINTMFDKVPSPSLDTASTTDDSKYREVRFIMYYAPWCGWSKKAIP